MHAGIAGAGLAGRLLAVKLQQQGWQITLFDRDSKAAEASCAFTAAGMLSPYAELEQGESLLFELGLRSLQLWPELLNSLARPVAWQQQGSLLVAHGQDQAELDNFIHQLNSKLNIHNLDQINALEPAAIAKLEPGLSHHRGRGYYLPLEGCIDNTALLTALAQQLDTDSVTWREKTTVTAVKPHQITTGSQCYTFDQVFDCRGLGAQADYADLRGMRGELVWLQAPNVKISRPIRLMHPRYRIYIVPRDDYYVVGASTIDSEDHSPISVRSLLELLSAAYSLDKGFSEARVLRTLVNCRPVFADHLPRIYRQPGLLAINGLYRHGYLLAPAVIEQALNLLAAQTTDTADFSKLIIKQ